MAGKQIEILVTAQDHASGVLRGVGDAAEQTGSKFGALNEIAETGHGLHHMLRRLAT